MNFGNWKRWLVWCAAVAGLAVGQTVGTPATAADDATTVAAVCIRSLDEIMADVGYLTRTAGTPEVGGLVTVLASQYTDGIDPKRPIGMYVTLDQGAPSGVVFVPVLDFSRILAKLREQVGQPEELGNGLLKLQLQQPVFIQQREGWAFVSNSVASLSQLPEDPLKLLGGIEKQYDISVRINVASVPEDLRERIVTEARNGYEKELEKQEAKGDQSETERALARKVGDSIIDFLSMVVRDADQLTLGWNVDSQAKAVYLEKLVTARSGTELARQMSLMSETRSAFTGFLLPEAAVAMNSSCKLNKSCAEQFASVIDALRDVALGEIEDDDDLPSDEAREVVQEAVSDLFDVLEDTASSGAVDTGFSLVLDEETMKFAGGAHVASQQGIEAALVKLVELAKDEPDFPGIKYNVATHRNVRFHQMTIPIDEDDEDAREIFGEEVDLFIGLGEKAFYFALGDESLALVKKAIDASNARTSGGNSLPLKATVALTPILSFAASMQEDPMTGALAKALKKTGGKDHLVVTAKPVRRGVAYRLEIEDGLLQAVGAAAKLQQQQQPTSKP